eukprot:657557-Rhodomonas_salina.1
MRRQLVVKGVPGYPGRNSYPGSDGFYTVENSVHRQRICRVPGVPGTRTTPGTRGDLGNLTPTKQLEAGQKSLPRVPGPFIPG